MPASRGIGVTLWGGKMSGSLRVAVEELAALTVGEDPLRIERIIAKLVAGTGDACGPGGIFTLALAAIDVALWDIKGKALEQPLWKLLGGHRNRVPTYASGSLRRGLTHDQAQKASGPPVLDRLGRQQGERQGQEDPGPAGHANHGEDGEGRAQEREGAGAQIGPEQADARTEGDEDREKSHHREGHRLPARPRASAPESDDVPRRRAQAGRDRETGCWLLRCGRAR